MGLFKWRKKAKQEQENTKAALPKAYYEEDAEARKQFVESYCALMSDVSIQLEESKREYQAVTESLTDIQLLDEFDSGTKKKLTQIAEKIIELNAERNEVKEEQQRISQNDYLHMMDIEKDYNKIIKRMEDDETYLQAVRSDMHHLEGEKGSLKFEIEGYEDRLELLSKLSRVLVGVLAVAIIALIVAVVGFAVDIILAGSIVFLVAAIMGVIILSFYQSFTGKIKSVKKKLNRAITLLNSAKIKYVNVTNSLDYQYIKHNVNSAYELSTLFEIYREVREERMRLQKTASALHKAEEELLEILYDNKLKNPQVWIYRVAALVDKREMVEVRHELNTSRQKLRTQMDYNIKVMDEAKTQIMDFAKINSHYADEIMQLVDTYKGL